MLSNKKLNRFLRIAVLGVCSSMAIAPVVSQHAFAAKAAEAQKVSAKVGKPLKEARELMDAKKWKEALAKTKEVAAIEGKNATEDAIINEMLAFCMVNLKDYAGAVAVYEKMLAAGQFKKEEEPKRILNMAQIYFALKNYPKAIELSERYLKVAGADLEVQRQIAQAYYLQNNFARSEEYAKRIIDTAKKQGKPIEEEWLQLLMSSQHKQNKKADVVLTLEQLLQTHPTDKYWSDMFTYLLQGSSFSDRQNVIYLKLVQKAGLLQPDEYIELAELSIAVTNPGDAKTILEEGFAKGVLGKSASKDRDLKLLNLAKTQAAEDLKLLPSIEKEAAAKPTGEALVKVGEAYLGHGQYENAIAAFSKGLAKGGVNNIKDDVNINIGIANLALNKKAEAIQAFKQVPSSSKLALMSRLWVIQANKTK
ncbi:tetratricopeptide repeat protein [Cellvibrio mixtus]|uniref:tetratricopeptide repeat protein n=1 Tax=Cellvibrio mixtus TaxID=39650 RepID=UPI000586BA65|nr:tetratricopeptide repeat protein [Cellvibrio mixtus]